MKKTKIICTLGPAVDNPETLESLILAGMDVARINFSHGNYHEQQDRIENFKRVKEKVGKPVALMLDTKGPEIRIGKFEKGEIWLEKGDIFTLKEEEVIGNKEQVSIYILETLKKYYPEFLKQRYQIENLEDTPKIIDTIGQKIGAISKNEVYIEKVSTIILKDLREGSLGKVTFDRFEQN